MGWLIGVVVLSGCVLFVWYCIRTIAKAIAEVEDREEDRWYK